MAMNPQMTPQTRPMVHDFVASAAQPANIRAIYGLSKLVGLICGHVEVICKVQALVGINLKEL